MKKYKKTIIGSAILLVILLVSCLYPLYGPSNYAKQDFIEDAHGNILGKPPYPPSFSHPLGTNRNGEDLGLLMLYGAKFTLITAFGVAVIRVLIGGLFGIFISLWAPFLKDYMKDFFLPFRYIPPILIAIILMTPIVGGFQDAPVTSIVTCQVIILIFIGLPQVSLMAADLTEELIHTSFVQSSFLMGASKWHIVRRQLLPYIRSFGLMFTVQQLLSTLQTMMHLGIFGLFLGGQTRAGIYGYDNPPKPASLSNEWAGIIGQNYNDFNLVPWNAFIPAFGFFLVILIVNMIKKDLENQTMGFLGVNNRRKKQMEREAAENHSSKQKFEFVHKIQESAKKSV
ncbi:hypothetical protein HPT25_21900 [Bacillus sp. BRMEA1]|uniref:ABC transporter permease subunit n=1 Tax=Neobacillus endophyticus TaxID=2738405 RepID=UPI001564DAF1|nr:ABC transporter permease subunit [Neobacillus endophyticus]NRD79993.1 hypothetical protein [Neobacillus endophyticus]